MNIPPLRTICGLLAASTLLLTNSLALVLDETNEDTSWQHFETFADDASLSKVSSTREGSVSLSDKHVLWDGQSLRWEWEAGDVLEFDHPFELRLNCLDSGIVYTPVFILNVYSEKNDGGMLRIESAGSSFSYNLNFTGWRSAQVRYYSDMKGETTLNGSGYRIHAPESGEGVLWLDGIIPNGLTYEANAEADFQQPYIADGINEHAGPGVYRARYDASKLRLQVKAPTADELEAIEALDLWLDDHILTAAANDRKATKDLQKLEQRVDQLLESRIAIRTKRQIDYVKPTPKVERPGNVFRLLKDLAVYYRKTQDPLARELYLKLALHARDNGWTQGSAMGTLHLTGYAGAQQFTEAHFLMRHELEKEGLRDTFAQDAQWWMNTPSWLIMPPKILDLDYMHTFMMPRVYAALISEDPAERIAWMHAYKTYHDAAFALNTHDVNDGYKSDGTAFHHYRHYPAYALGGINHVGEIYQLLKNTPFALDEQALDNVRRAALRLHATALPDAIPVSLGGRHPFKYPTAKDSFAEAVELLEARALPESSFWEMPFAGMGVQRRPNWFVLMHGFDEYLPASEGWAPANRYGLFNKHGSVEIMLNEGLEASGYKHEGWDWRKLPGTTACLAPYPVILTQESKSKETFLGALTLDGLNGQFGMKLDSSYVQLTAKKSVTAFGNVLVCLGNDIVGWRGNYSTITTLFQTHAPEAVNDKIETINELHHLRDAVNNHYLLEDSDNLKTFQGVQHSLNQNDGKPNEGRYYTAWLDHGPRPDGKSYSYTVLVQPEDGEVEAYANAPTVQVLEQSNQAHIVQDKTTGITAFTLFEAGKVNHSQLKAVSIPCMIQTQAKGDSLQLAVCNPDLQLQQTQFDWVSVVLKGEWDAEAHEDLVNTHIKDGETTITVQPKNGKTVQLILTRR